MSKFVIHTPEAEEQKPEKEIIISSAGRKNDREKIAKNLIKMFRAASNGKNYYKKWFPEYKDTGDFAAGFASEVYKLVKK